MKAVLRLNLIISGVFVLALVVTLLFLTRQAEVDIEREIDTSLQLYTELLNIPGLSPQLVGVLLSRDVRHLDFSIAESDENLQPEAKSETEDQAPAWFISLLPEINELQTIRFEKKLADDVTLIIRAAPEDEIQEVWESAKLIIWLFLFSAIGSNLAVYWGVKKGLKPVGDFLQGLNNIRQGHLDARLQQYKLPEVNEMAEHFNAMAKSLEHQQEENQYLSRELMKVQENERAYLARELHDDLGQYVTGIRAQAYLVQHSDVSPKAEQAASLIVSHCEAMQKSFRRLIQDLHPVILDQLGICKATSDFVEQWQLSNGIECKIDLCNTPPVLPFDHTIHIFRFVQEALNNIAQHAEARSATVELTESPNQLTVRVSDDGIGMPKDVVRGLGLRSMKERAHAIGGELHIQSIPNTGTTLTLTYPLPQEKQQ